MFHHVQPVNILVILFIVFSSSLKTRHLVYPVNTEFSPRVCWCLNLFISQESNSGRDCLMEKNRQGDTVQYKKITMLPEMNNMNTEEKRAAQCKSIHRRTHRAALSHPVAMTPFLFFPNLKSTSGFYLASLCTESYFSPSRHLHLCLFTMS